MADDTASVEQTADTAGTESTTTLADVYKEFNVDEMASSFKPAQQLEQRQQTQVRTITPDSVPDPLLDANGFKQFQAKQAQSAEETGNHLSKLAGAVQRMQQAQIREQEERDIGAAVQKIKEAGFEAENDFIEIALGQKAKQDARFLAVFNNRGKNPAAWNKALAAVANEMKGKYQFRSDPNLAANVRAAKNSTQTAQTTAADRSGNPLEKRFADLKTPGEFNREWEALVGRGY